MVIKKISSKNLIKIFAKFLFVVTKLGDSICFQMKEAIIAVNTNYPNKSDYQLVDLQQNSRFQLHKLYANSNWSFCLRALIRSKIIYYEFDVNLKFSIQSLRRNKYFLRLFHNDSIHSTKIFERMYTFTGN